MLAGFSVFDVLRYMQRAAKAIGINRCASEKEVLLVKVVSFLQDSSGSDMAIVAFSCYCSKLISKNASSTSQVTVHSLRRQCSELLIIGIVTVKTTYTAYLFTAHFRTNVDYRYRTLRRQWIRLCSILRTLHAALPTLNYSSRHFLCMLCCLRHFKHSG